MINTLQLTARKNLIQMSSITIVSVIPDFQGTYQQLAYFVFSYLENNVFKNRPGTISVITDNCNLIN
jgi:hypothetical protein